MENILFIEGYANQLSVAAGEEIGFHISTNIKSYSVKIYRIGLAQKLVWSDNELHGKQYPVPENATSHGCGWPVQFSLTIPKSWKSGYYSVILRGFDDSGSVAKGEISFVVRSAHPGRDTKILFQRSINTDNAYNSWGGSTMYSGPNGPTRRASFDRPFAGFADSVRKFLFDIDETFQDSFNRGEIPKSLIKLFSDRGYSLTPYAFISTDQKTNSWHIRDAGNHYTVKIEKNRLNIYDGFTALQSPWHIWEHKFIIWAENEGYKFDYAVNSDLEFNPEILNEYKLVLSIGHDEYWSSPMRDNLESYIASGGNVAFFSGNNVFWQVRSEDNGRAMVCWKEEYEKDPFYKTGNHKLLSTLWCNTLINRPENQLTGVSFAYGGYYRFFDKFWDGSGAYTIHRPEHWIFEGTDLKQGDLLGAQNKIVSYECDGCEFELQNGLPIPTYRDGTPNTFEILGSAPSALSSADNSLEMVTAALYGEETNKTHSQPGAAILGIYTKGGTVLTTGCTNWSDGLEGGDKAVEQITKNILNRLSK